MTFFETSAKTGQNINQAFERISRDIIKNIDANKEISSAGPSDTKDGKKSTGHNIGKIHKEGKKSKCCK